MKHLSTGVRPSLIVAAMRRPRPWLMVFAQFFPVVALSAAYPAVERSLSSAHLEGVPFTVLIISCAVITPTLAQAVAAPVYLALIDVDQADPRDVCAATARAIPRSMATIGPLIVVAAVPVVVARELPLGPATVFVGLLLLHVLMGALMVPAYALRSPALLVIGWGVYASALLAAPALLWLPAASASAAIGTVVLLAGRGSSAMEPPSFAYSKAFVAALRGAAEGLPLWSIPVVLWLGDSGLGSIGFVYAALLPAVLAHQLFFVQIVDPGWRQLDRARGLLSSAPYEQARAVLERFAERIDRGIGRASVLLVLLSLTLVVASMSLRWDGAGLIVLIVLTASAAVLAMMQGYTIAMVGTALPLGLLGASAATVTTAGLVLGLEDQAILTVACIVYVAAAIGMVPLRRASMRRPEYAMFWRGALAQ